MKKLLIILIASLSLSVQAQIKLGIINYDSLECCKTIRGKTGDNEIFDVPVIYTAQYAVDSISGYPNFILRVVSSTDGDRWNVLNTITKSPGTIVWDSNNKWDTLIIETTPFAAEYLGLEVETVDSTQVAKHKHDLIIQPYNLFTIPTTLP